MAANTNPIFTLTPVEPCCQISTANTNRDGTGTIADLVSGATDGTRVEGIRVIATGTTTAGMVRIFYHNGSAWRLLDEISISAITPSGTVAAFDGELYFSRPFVVKTGCKLGAAPHNAETFNIFALGVGSYT